MFHFKLQPVLDYRKQIEEQLLSEFADAKRRLNYEKERLELLENKKKALIAQLESMSEGDITIADISLCRSYLERIRDDEKCQHEVVLKLDRELEDKRIKLLDAIKKRKILEVIKEKKTEEYRTNLILNERKELDEFGVSRSGRGKEIEETDNYL
ncbi:MAG: flagellar export protein FliJ [Deltaproteobacteria bacterium]|nr:flagellar export protein FliJ [Deltaproteobacteria bacterium]